MRGVFNTVRDLFVQQEVVGRTVLEVGMISDRVGYEVKLAFGMSSFPVPFGRVSHDAEVQT